MTRGPDEATESTYLAFATMSVTDSTSSREDDVPGMKVMPSVVVSETGRSMTMIVLMDVFTDFVIETSLGSAVSVKLTVALDSGDVRR